MPTASARLRYALPLGLVIGLAAAAAAQPVVTTLTEPFAGSGGVTLHPTTGDLFVGNFGDAFGQNPADWGNHVNRVTPDGAVSVFATGFYVASGNAMAADGETLLQVELGRGLVFKVSPSGTVTQWASGLANPVGIVASADGGAFVAECGGNTIRRIEPDGSTSYFAVHEDFNCPNGITMGPDGTLYTVNFSDGKIFEIDPDGTVRLLATGPGGNNGHVAYAAGRLYVADRGGNQVLGVSLEGEVEVIAGSGAPGNADGPAAEATFERPNGIAVTPDGRTIYLSSKVSEDPAELNPVVIRVISGVTVSQAAPPAAAPPAAMSIAPNPSQRAVTVRYRLGAPGAVEVAVYAVDGRRVAVLASGERSGAEHAVTWDGRDAAGRAVAAGVYVCRLRTADGHAHARRFTLLP